MIPFLKNKVSTSKTISKSDAIRLTELNTKDAVDLFAAANWIRETYKRDSVELCSIVNAKSGACPEDCAYCAQSSKSKSNIAIYPLLNRETVLRKAEEALKGRVKRFSIVMSGRKASPHELKKIAEMIKGIRDLGLSPCASLGLLNKDELIFLRESGLDRYHHNLETSEKFFPKICKTHTYRDKITTIESARRAGLSVCSGGLFGMGETWQDRVDMALAVRQLQVDSVPINFLIPIVGTNLADRALLQPFEALKIISLYRFMLPETEIRMCGGRIQVLGEFASMVFMAGADSLMTGDYLTTTGRTFEDDLRLIRLCCLKVS
ncbi:MAG: biotin synthase BioB [Dissulfurispiraceae bacterium]